MVARHLPVIGWTVAGRDLSADVVQWTIAWGTDARARRTHPIRVVPALGQLVIDSPDGKHLAQGGGAVTLTIDGETAWQGQAQRVDPVVLTDHERAYFALVGPNDARLAERARLWWRPAIGDDGMTDLVAEIQRESGLSLTILGAVSADVPAKVIDWRPADGSWTDLLEAVSRYIGGWVVEDRGGHLRVVPVREVPDPLSAIGSEFTPVRGSQIVPRDGMRIDDAAVDGIRETLVAGQTALGDFYVFPHVDSEDTVVFPRTAETVASWQLTAPAGWGASLPADLQFADEVTVRTTAGGDGNAALSATVVRQSIGDRRSVGTIGPLENRRRLDAPQWARSPLPNGSLGPLVLAAALGAGEGTTPWWVHGRWPLEQPTEAMTDQLLTRVDAGKWSLVTIQGRRAAVLWLWCGLRGGSGRLSHLEAVGVIIGDIEIVESGLTPSMQPPPTPTPPAPPPDGITDTPSGDGCVFTVPLPPVPAALSDSVVLVQARAQWRRLDAVPGAPSTTSEWVAIDAGHDASVMTGELAATTWRFRRQLRYQFLDGSTRFVVHSDWSGWVDVECEQVAPPWSGTTLARFFSSPTAGSWGSAPGYGDFGERIGRGVLSVWLENQSWNGTRCDGTSGTMAYSGGDDWLVQFRPGLACGNLPERIYIGFSDTEEGLATATRWEVVRVETWRANDAAHGLLQGETRGDANNALWAGTPHFAAVYATA